MRGRRYEDYESDFGDRVLDGRLDACGDGWASPEFAWVGRALGRVASWRGGGYCSAGNCDRPAGEALGGHFSACDRDRLFASCLRAVRSLQSARDTATERNQGI